MAKPNYSFEKRKRELAKKEKKEAKRLKKSLSNAPEESKNQEPRQRDENTPS